MSSYTDEPKRPYVVSNEHYILLNSPHKNWKTRLKEIMDEIIDSKKTMSSPNISDKISKKGLNSKKGYKNCFIYDSECNKYQVNDIVLKGRERDIFNLFGLVGEPWYYFDFVVGEPVHMNFDDLKKEILDHIVDRRFYHGTGAGAKIYREMREDLSTPEELYESISFGGTYPF